MRRIKFVFLGLALVLASGGAALAGEVTVQLTGANGGVANGVYVGPYQLVVGSYPSGANPVNLNAVCDDFADHIDFNETWDANEIPLLAAGYSSNPPLYGPNAHLYWAAAYLTSLFGQPGYSNGDISFAIWGLFNTGAQNFDTESTTLASNALSLASFYGDNLNDFPGWQILTPINGTQSEGGQPQEFLIPGGTRTPEPATLALLGSGLLAMGLTLRKKRASSPLA